MQSLETLLNTPLEGRLVRAREISYRLSISVPALSGKIRWISELFALDQTP